MPKKRKQTSLTDQEIIRQLKKNRVFSKVITKDYPTDHTDMDFYVNTINEKINELSVKAKEKIRIYILDKLYDNGDINFLITAADCYSFVVYDEFIFNRLKNDNLLIVPDNIRLSFFNGEELPT